MELCWILDLISRWLEPPRKKSPLQLDYEKTNLRTRFFRITWMSQEVSKLLGSGLLPIYRQVITHLLTIDPNFQRDIQVALWGRLKWPISGVTSWPGWSNSRSTKEKKKLVVFPPGVKTKQAMKTNGTNQFDTYLSYDKKKHLALLSIESWLVNRDPYNGLRNNPYITG